MPIEDGEGLLTNATFPFGMAEMDFNSERAQAGEAKPPDRRRFSRVRCSLLAEIRPPQSSFPLQAETTDVSLGGCYVATMFPLPKGMAIDFRCWVSGTPIACKAVIRTMDPGVGNGIEFVDLDELSRVTLSNYLDTVREEGAGAGSMCVIHPRI